jgi:protease I
MQKRLLLSVLIALLVPALALADEKTSDLKGKHIVMIIAERWWHTHEFTDLKELFEREGAAIIVASSTLSEITRSGLTVKPDILVKDIVAENFDAVIFIGGAGCLQYASDYHAHEIAKQALKEGKILAAIHQAPRILAEAGLLTGKKATCTSSAQSYLKDKGAVVTNNNIERDGNIFTAIGPSAVKELGEAIVLALYE